MIILDPKTIKDEKSETLEQGKKRTNAISIEEARLARSINLAREDADKEIKKIEEEKQEKIKLVAMSEADISVTKNVLIKTIEDLERRKSEALKPINDEKEFLNDKKKEIEEGNNKLVVDKEKIKEEQKNLSKRYKQVEKSEIIIKEKNENLDIRDAKIIGTETGVKRSTAELGTKWIEFNKSSEEFKKTKSEFEVSSQITKESLDNRQKEQDKREIEQNNKERAIRDKYLSLQVAREEILGRKT